MAVLEVIHPLALIPRPVHVNVDALPVGLIVDPVSFVHISVDMREFAEAMCPIVFPVALIASTVLPDLFTIAVSEPTDPLSCKLCTRRVGIGRPLLPLGIWVIGLV